MNIGGPLNGGGGGGWSLVFEDAKVLGGGDSRLDLVYLNPPIELIVWRTWGGTLKKKRTPVEKDRSASLVGYPEGLRKLITKRMGKAIAAKNSL